MFLGVLKSTLAYDLYDQSYINFPLFLLFFLLYINELKSETTIHSIENVIDTFVVGVVPKRKDSK
jgi:hypothetical protein